MACIRWATVVKQKIYLMGHSIELNSMFYSDCLVLLIQYIFFKVCVMSLLLILNII